MSQPAIQHATHQPAGQPAHQPGALLASATGIKQAVLDRISELARRHNLRKVVLFGSRSRGDFKSRSDIDLACSGGDFVRFSLDVDETCPTLLEFDFVNLDEPMQAALRDSIAQEGTVLYEEAR